ncbi:MAG: ABC-2 family transporter protein [Anaerolineaceae bacterium]|jgi:ABC-2 type transport system permease protein|nr:ABC-2 family transporter protein [Anaerolineaceae bacterium]
MTAFFATIRTSFRRQLTYRAANLSGLATNLMFAFFRAAVLIALYNEQPSVNGLSLQAAVTYAGLTQSLIGYLSFFHWYDMMHTVYDGQIGADLLKPMSLFTYWLGIDVGRAMGAFLIRSLPLFLVFALFYDVVVPASFVQWLAFLLAVILALLVSFAWHFLVNLAAFWTPNALGIGRFAFGLSWTFSGFFMPLALFPDWLARFSKLTPFGASVYVPIEIFLGTVQGAAMLQSLLVQAAWVVILVLIDYIVLSLGVRKLVIQGG